MPLYNKLSSLNQLFAPFTVNTFLQDNLDEYSTAPFGSPTDPDIGLTTRPWPGSYQPNAFYDIQDVEVLRGPQSTLYGRGATGGAVNVQTARPQLDQFAADGSASYGNYNATEIRAMVNLPIIDDQLGIRVAGDWVRHDGFTNNIFPGAAQADGRDM